MTKKNILPLNIAGFKNVVCVNTHVINCANYFLPMQYQQKKAGLRNEIEVNKYSLGLCFLPCISQGFARDFMVTDGTSFINGLGGAEVLSCNDGVVIAVEDCHEPGELIDQQSKAAGNYIIVKNADGNYALYAHLLAGSIKVRVGQRVERGQVLACVGNTGNSTCEHLHFQLTWNDPRTLNWIGGIAHPLNNFEPYQSAPLSWNEVFAQGFVKKEFKENVTGSVNSVEFLS